MASLLQALINAYYHQRDAASSQITLGSLVIVAVVGIFLLRRTTPFGSLFPTSV